MPQRKSRAPVAAGSAAKRNPSSQQDQLSTQTNDDKGASADLLGGAERKRTRPRGYAPWQPDPATATLLEQINAVLEEYAEHLPLTIRQIFYRLVGAHDYAKTEASYKRLCVVLNRARRAELIPMDAIRDDGGTILAPTTFEGVEDFFSNMRAWAEDLRLDRTKGQRARLVVICEAAGMAPQLERVAAPYGITVISSGGFDSLTGKFELASTLIDSARPTEVLHIGDHDPSGTHIFLSLAEDVQAFARTLGGTITFTRLAVTPQQMRDYDLPTAPAKDEDKRAFNGLTCQAEAFAPDVLARILKEAITARLESRAYEKTLRAERKVRKAVLVRLGVQSEGAS